MIQSNKKSIPYYIVLFCLALIGGTSLFAFVWQPSFVDSYISFPYHHGGIVFSLWVFVPTFVSIALFIYFTFKTIGASFNRKLFLVALLLGISSVTLYLFLISNFGYSSTSSEDFQVGQSDLSFAIPLFVPVILIVLTMGFLVYRKRKLALQVIE
jgi:hypothetical protein